MRADTEKLLDPQRSKDVLMAADSPCSNISPMKMKFVPIAVLPLCLVGCASNSEMQNYQAAIRRQGYVAYYQPVGNPRNVKDWDKFGPGTILRVGKTQEYYYAANKLIGPAGVRAAMDRKNASPVSLFSGKRVSGYDIDGKGGWTIDAANKIGASLNLKSVTNVDIQFGNAYKANPKGEGDLHRLVAAKQGKFDANCRNALRKGDFVVVQNAIWTDSIRCYFKQNKEGGGSADYKLSKQEIANLSAKGYKVIEGGVQVDQARFIAFTPLPGVANDLGGEH